MAEKVDILKDIDKKFSYYDPELYLDPELSGTEEKIIERVQVGAYERHHNAVNMFNKVSEAGFDCYITTEAGEDISVDALRRHIS